MQFSLIICTYMRPKPLLQLLQSVEKQTLYPSEILVIDGSDDGETAAMLEANHFKNLEYILAPEGSRGLTKQRNLGIERVNTMSEVIAFLDDDTALLPDYFQVLIKTFESDNDITGVGGVAINQDNWLPVDAKINYNKFRFYQFDGFVIKEGQRNVIRNYLRLQSHLPPGVVPDYSHSKVCGFPLNGKTYEVDLLIGMSFAFRKFIFNSIKFATYFEGYGLYEDADFSIRALQFGKNVINTNLQLYHYHDASGRPNQYKYGKMVVRNGWYVWRVKNPNPSLKAQLKWNTITLLLGAIRYTNVITTKQKKQAITEALGRTIGWLSLIVNKPKIEA
ncbi:MAG: glycosyltransferase family 2 protein [Flavobacterium sp.]|nr:glycosyltransferase family 2 protein [Flavobacterium sp.]